ncbi:hypothetical protein L1887_62003 [Cichorium endivia]|nr:hypothetical protein L1887_62003 [Cichorium endivia]
MFRRSIVQGAGVAAEPVKRRASSAKAAAASAEGGVSFPCRRRRWKSTDLTVKAKRVTKASKAKAIEEDEQDSDLAEDLEDDTSTGAATIEGATASDRILHRMRFVDLDAGGSRVETLRGIALSPPCDHIGSVDWGSSERLHADVRAAAHCSSGRAHDQRRPPCSHRALCAVPRASRPYAPISTLHSVPTQPSSTAPVVSTTAAAPSRGEAERCNSVYHLSCLANSFLEQQSAIAPQDADAASSRNTVLPTHGACPRHPPVRADGEDGRVDSVAFCSSARAGRWRTYAIQRPSSRPTRAKKGAKASEDTIAAGEAEQKGKKRKPRKPTTEEADASSAEAPPAEKAARKKPGRKKALPVEVIDLT